jgi:hypothetical protein
MPHVVRSLLVASMLMAAGAPAFAQQAASDADKAACRSDAIKFCRAQVGKPKEMLDCLGKVKDQLAPACAAVVAASAR